MKIKVNREITIGLSVLLLLTVVLVVVVARRFMRPNVPQDVAAVGQSEKCEQPAQENHRAKDFETRKPTLPAPVPDLTTIKKKEEKKDRHEEAIAKATREEKPGKAAVRIEASAAPSSDRYAVPHDQSKTGEAVRATPDRPAAPATGAEDRYAVRPLTPPANLPADDGLHGAGRPLVVQVSGEAAEAPSRPIPGRAAEGRTGASTPAAAIPSSVRGENRVTRAAEPPRREVPPAAPSLAERDRRYNDDTVGAAPTTYDGPTAYPGPGGGNTRDDSPRREATQPPVAANPLREGGTYEVQPNDNYWTISERVYGSGAYFRALAEVNRGTAARPDRLSPGLVISTPPVAQLQKDYPDFCPRPNRREAVRNRAAGSATLAGYTAGQTYVVQEGDSLTSIARNELGRISRWAEIYQLNRAALGKDYDYLTPGMKLIMPPHDGPSSDRTARQNAGAPPFTR